MEQTCILVKPDGVCKNIVGTVLDRFAKAGLQLRGLKMLKLSRGSRRKSFIRNIKGNPFMSRWCGS